MEDTFTTEELDLMYTQSVNMSRPIPTQLWQRGFTFYNRNNDKKLGLGCTPCYYKVLLFIYKTELAKAKAVPPTQMSTVFAMEAMGNYSRFEEGLKAEEKEK